MTPTLENPAVMAVTQDIIDIAKAKASKLGDKQMIRVGGWEYTASYWVAHFNGKMYIGTAGSDHGKLPLFYPNQPSFEFVPNNRPNHSDGTFQRFTDFYK